MSKTYRLEHITDLAFVPNEHWDECIETLKAGLVCSRMMFILAEDAPGVPDRLAKFCTHIDFTPDGDRKITPVLNGVPLPPVDFGPRKDGDR